MDNKKERTETASLTSANDNIRVTKSGCVVKPVITTNLYQDSLQPQVNIVVKYGEDAGKCISKVMNVYSPTMVQGNQEDNYSMLQPLILNK